MMTVIAHQGGWDEILMVAGPLLVFAGLLYLANKRANLKLAEAAAAGEEPGAAVPAVSESDQTNLP